MPSVPKIPRPFRIALFAIAMASTLSAQETVPLPSATDVQKKTVEWILARKLIGEESAAWQEEKATLSELNAIRLKESEQLDEFVKAAGDRVEELAGKRAAFAKEESDLKTWRSELETDLTALEAGLKPLIAIFPAPLRDKVGESLRRLEAPEADLPLQDRTRDLLLVLQACLEFQNTITFAMEIREIGGERREVEVLYLGLTQAWYVDASNVHSGYGIPTEGQWIWTEDPSVASQVRSAIEVQTRRKPPAFVELPLSNGTREKEVPK